MWDIINSYQKLKLMKIKKLIALASLAVLLSACEKEEILRIESPDESTSSLKSALLKGTSNNNSFIVISKANKLPNGLVKGLASAKGSLVSTIPEIGLAVATSDDPDFLKNASKIKGVQSVVPNLTTQWLDPDAKMVSFDADYGNPPASGDDDFLFDLQWGHDAIDAPEAWDTGAKGAGARVGVLDTGFDLTHPDLAPNINVGLSANFVDGEDLQYAIPDAFSHGSHTAGTIAAADNAFGTIGVAPEAELVLIKVLSDAGSGSFGDIISGIIYSALVGCDVINMSIGATLEKSGIPGEYTAREVAELKNALGRAVTYAYQNGTTVITSAGNESTDYDHSADLIHLPSGVAHAISISATSPIGWAVDPSTNLDVFASYSNYGQSAIDFAAPGGDWSYYYVVGLSECNVIGIPNYCYYFDFVLSTGNGGWFWSAGTSMAAPHATGVAALIIGKNGGSMEPAQVKAAMRASADDLGKPGRDDFYGQGRVNAYKAVAK